MEYYLCTRYDRRLSFYGKALVREEGEDKTLLSYLTPVCKIQGGKVLLLDKWDYSSTTLRHVKEFLLQHGFKAESKKQIDKDYDHE